MWANRKRRLQRLHRLHPPQTGSKPTPACRKMTLAETDRAHGAPPATSVQIASDRTIRTVDRLRTLVRELPAVFPTAEHRRVLPLKLHVAEDLHDRVVVPPDMH